MEPRGKNGTLQELKAVKTKTENIAYTVGKMVQASHWKPRNLEVVNTKVTHWQPAEQEPT